MVHVHERDLAEGAAQSLADALPVGAYAALVFAAAQPGCNAAFGEPEGAFDGFDDLHERYIRRRARQDIAAQGASPRVQETAPGQHFQNLARRGGCHPHGRRHRGDAAQLTRPLGHIRHHYRAVVAQFAKSQHGQFLACPYGTVRVLYGSIDLPFKKKRPGHDRPGRPGGGEGSAQVSTIPQVTKASPIMVTQATSPAASTVPATSSACPSSRRS